MASKRKPQPPADPSSASSPVPTPTDLSPAALPPAPPREIMDIVREVGVYPLEAYEFVRYGLADTVERVHATLDPEASRHVSGQQLSLGLRRYAWERWGYLARAVLTRWNVTCTHDFGRIVYALIAAGHLDKTEGDRLEDFHRVFEFTTLETAYVAPASARPPVGTACPKH